MLTKAGRAGMEESPLEAHLRLTEMVAKGAPLEDVLDAALRFCEARSPEMLCSILLLDADGKTLRHGAAPSLPAAYRDVIDGKAIGPRAGSCGTAVFRREPVFVEDILTDPLWAEYRAYAAPYGLRACWSTPILDAAGAALGSFAIYYRTPGLPTAGHMATIRLITHIAGIAIASCRAERERRQVFERISDAFVALDREWRYTYVNKKAGEYFGRKAKDLIGKHIWTEFPEGRGQKFHLAYEKSMAEQIPMCIEEYYPPYDSWFENRIYPSPQGLTIYFCDISERKRGEERLRQAEKLVAIGQLAGGVAHDFNNQLSIILGYAGLLESRLTDTEMRRFASAVVRAANRSGDLTRNLLTFSRQGIVESVPVDMHELIAEVCELLSHSLDKRIALRQIPGAERATIVGDPASLQSALLNLALNARDAMPRGGGIHFRTGIVHLPLPGAQPAWIGDTEDPVPGPYLHLEVTDSGMGMGEAVRRRIFEPFFTTKPVGKGTGLGLPSVLGTVRTHRGRIALDSAEGRGSTFHLYLPMTVRPAKQAFGKEDSPTRGGLTVLVVDDDSPVREIMRDMLSAGGNKVLEASHGREALDIYRKRGAEIDVVILDMMMPDMDGAEVFAGLRAIDPRARVIISTGFSADAKIPSLLAAGAKGLLRKPYEKPLLDKMLGAAMA
jgi:PAS domain S-box-containing protein